MTAEEVMQELRLIAPDIEMIYYLYVVDNREHLEGVLSLKDLILANPRARLDTLMKRNAKKIHVNADRKEAAEMVSKYNLMAVPVVDDQDILQGIITVDDIVDFLLPTPLRKRR
jgi:Mg/Co/Ni transporter MgtE